MGFFGGKPNKPSSETVMKPCKGCGGLGYTMASEGGVNFEGKYEQRQVQVRCAQCGGRKEVPAR